MRVFVVTFRKYHIVSTVSGSHVYLPVTINRLRHAQSAIKTLSPVTGERKLNTIVPIG